VLPAIFGSGTQVVRTSPPKLALTSVKLPLPATCPAPAGTEYTNDEVAGDGLVGSSHPAIRTAMMSTGVSPNFITRFFGAMSRHLHRERHGNLD
jgi:hypothetical protein